jgi:Tol biopolymer transport system component
MSTRRGLLTAASISLVGAGLVGFAPAAEAQYFGRNKVQYENLDFEVLKTEHFDIHYYEEEGVAIEYAALMAERWYARLSRLLNHDLSGRQPLIMYASGPHFRQTNTLQGDISEATGGVTEILKRRIVLPFSGPLSETDHVLGHELVHAFQFDITGEGGGIAKAGVPSIMRYPLWFTEGMAEYLSVGPRDPNTAMWMRDAVRAPLPDLQRLSDPRIFPYRYGQALWSYIAGRWGDDAVGRILKASRTAGGAPMAFGRVLRMAPDSVIYGWHQAMRSYYEPLEDVTGRAGDYGRPVITPFSTGGRLNVGPALSPDGSRVVFISERDLFSIDIFLADAFTGQIIRKITRNDVNPHFESLQFIYTSGAWDYEGQRFAFGAVAKGRPVLTIIEPESGDKLKEVKFKELGEIYTPTWSPDGRYVAFSALVGGFSDLFMYDLEEDQLLRLTNDVYGDLQPAWSPDGSQIAFVTDRFGTGVSSLMYGNYRLALMDPRTMAIRPVVAFPEGKHINPQWTPDASSLYFVSDHNGIPNVYRTDLATNELFQVTNLFTGVSGIAGISPAISVAAETGDLAITVYEEDANSIYLLEDPDVLVGGPVYGDFAIDPAALPPSDRLTDDVPSLLANAFYGLPRDRESFEMSDYKPKFALDYIGQPSLAVGADRYGTYIAGGASFFFSDMLGGHNVATAIEIRGSFRDIGGLIGYSNTNKRLNWGVNLQQTPYITAQAFLFEDSASGALIERTIIQRQTFRQVGTVAAYPLNRAQRLEFNGRFLNIGYATEARDRLFDPISLIQIGEDESDLPAPLDLNLFQASVALVYDNSLFGITSPMLGQRYRLEFGGTYNDLDYVTGVVDYRKYVMPVRPFTLAFRFLHNGRYGPDADTLTLAPLYLGYDGIVRGYEFSSFDFGACAAAGGLVGEGGIATCAPYDNLFGSKMMLANLELRFPPLGVLGVGDGLFGYLPIEAYIFGDGGLAWYSEDRLALTPGFDDRAWWDGGESRPVFSMGGGLRMNFFGFLVLGVHYVYPFNRTKGGHFQFTFIPGF